MKFYFNMKFRYNRHLHIVSSMEQMYLVVCIKTHKGDLGYLMEDYI